MELGTTFGHTVITHPKICAHLLGQIINAFGVDRVLFGTDAIWWGSPQWQIEAFRRFQIPEEMREKFGYPEITDDDKAKILGLNAAKLYSIDVPSTIQKISIIDQGSTRLRSGGQLSIAEHVMHAGWFARQSNIALKFHTHPDRLFFQLTMCTWCLQVLLVCSNPAQFNGAHVAYVHVPRSKVGSEQLRRSLIRTWENYRFAMQT